MFYQEIDTAKQEQEKEFPAPLEVDRVFYDKPEFTVEPEGVMFPSPREVNRVFYIVRVLKSRRWSDEGFRPLSR